MTRDPPLRHRLRGRRRRRRRHHAIQRRPPACGASPGDPQADARRPVLRLRHQRRDALGLRRPAQRTSPTRRGCSSATTPSTPTIDKATWRLGVFGDGLSTPRGRRGTRSRCQLRRPAGLPERHPRVGARVHGQRPQLLRLAAGADRVRDVVEARLGGLRRLDGRPAARRAQAHRPRAGRALDPGDRPRPGVQHRGRQLRAGPSSVPGRARRSTTRSSRGASTASRCCPTTATRCGWSCRAGSGSAASSGSARSRSPTTELTSPWNTKWYRLTGGDYPADSPPLTVNPVRSAFELPLGATLPPGRVTLTGRSWSGAARIQKVEVSVDGGATWRPREARGQPDVVRPVGRPRPRLVAVVDRR